MSVAAAQADAFYREVLANEHVYAVRDDGGFPAPVTSAGMRAMPFWSKRSRAVDNVDAYREMDVVEFTLAEWLEKWVPGLDRDGLLIGLNWSGQGESASTSRRQTCSGIWTRVARLARRRDEA